MLNQKSIFSPIVSTSQKKLESTLSDKIQDNFDRLVNFFPVWTKAKKNEGGFFVSNSNKDKEIYQLINADNLSSIELESIISLVKAQIEIEQKQLNIEQEKFQKTTQTLVNIRRYQQFIGEPSDSFVFFFNIFVSIWGVSMALQAYIDPEEFLKNKKNQAGALCIVLLGSCYILAKNWFSMRMDQKDVEQECIQSEINTLHQKLDYYSWLHSTLNQKLVEKVNETKIINSNEDEEAFYSRLCEVFSSDVDDNRPFSKP